MLIPVLSYVPQTETSGANIRTISHFILRFGAKQGSLIPLLNQDRMASEHILLCLYPRVDFATTQLSCLHTGMVSTYRLPPYKE